jgi:hypothetical protein
MIPVPIPLRVAAAAALVAAAVTHVASAQDPAGSVKRIAEVGAGAEEHEIKSGTPLVRIRRNSGGRWTNAGPRTPIFELDSMVLQRYVDVQVEMKGDAYQGVLTFLPELIVKDKVIVYRPEISTDTALYSVTGAPDVHVGVDIVRGALVVQWDEGRLEILAAGHRIAVHGTRLAVAVDSTGNNAYVFLESGAIVFPDSPGTTVAEGDVINLQRGLPPVRAEAPSVPRSQLSRAVDFNHRQIWSAGRPFFLKPWFYVPVGLVAGGIIASEVIGGGDRRGTVVVRIPFD